MCHEWDLVARSSEVVNFNQLNAPCVNPHPQSPLKPQKWCPVLYQCLVHLLWASVEIHVCNMYMCKHRVCHGRSQTGSSCIHLAPLTTVQSFFTWGPEEQGMTWALFGDPSRNGRVWYLFTVIIKQLHKIRKNKDYPVKCSFISWKLLMKSQRWWRFTEFTELKPSATQLNSI